MSLTAFAKMFPDLVSPMVLDEPVNLYVSISGLVRSVRAADVEELHSRVFQAVKTIVDRVCPRLLFVAFDGSLPLVKLVDQRRRNYKETSQMLRNGSERLARSEILSMAGTNFMHELTAKITAYFKDKDLQYELSPMSTPNESVCKIASTISKNQEDVVHIVSGTDSLDAFLGAAFENKQIVFDVSNDKILNLSSLRQEVNNCVHKISKNSPTACLRDICFISKINQLGPIPVCLPSLDKIIDIYGQSLSICKAKSLHDRTTSVDANILKSIFTKMQKHNSISSVEPPRSRPTTITTRDEKWRSRYWKLVFNIDDSCFERKRAVIKDYCKALVWLADSINSSVNDWQWFYNHDAAPPLQDVIDHIELIGEGMLFTKNRPLKPLENLALVADYDGLGLLPTSFRERAKSPTLAYLYPETLDMISVDGHTEILRLPYVEPSTVVQAMKSSKLTTQEKERNKLDK